MITVRIFFEKRAEAAYISLLDLQRVFQRLLKISGLPVWYSQGYNPHIYLSFSCPLSLGQESVCESCEVKTEAESVDYQAWQAALQPLMPRGIVITKVAQAQHKVGEIVSAAYTANLPAAAAASLDAYNALTTAPITKKTKRGQKTLELKEHLQTLTYTPQGDRLQCDFELPCGSGEALNINPALLLTFLQSIGGVPAWQCSVLRTHLFCENRQNFC